LGTYPQLHWQHGSSKRWRCQCPGLSTLERTLRWKTKEKENWLNDTRLSKLYSQYFYLSYPWKIFQFCKSSRNNDKSQSVATFNDFGNRYSFWVSQVPHNCKHTETCKKARGCICDAYYHNVPVLNANNKFNRVPSLCYSTITHYENCIQFWPANIVAKFIVRR